MNDKDFSLLTIIQTVLIAVLEVVILAVPLSLSQEFEAKLNQRNPGIVGPQRFENDDDLHPYCAEPDDQRSEKLAGFLIQPLTLAAMSQFADTDQSVF